MSRGLEPFCERTKEEEKNNFHPGAPETARPRRWLRRPAHATFRQAIGITTEIIAWVGQGVYIASLRIRQIPPSISLSIIWISVMSPGGGGSKKKTRDRTQKRQVERKERKKVFGGENILTPKPWKEELERGRGRSEKKKERCEVMSVILTRVGSLKSTKQKNNFMHQCFFPKSHVFSFCFTFFPDPPSSPPSSLLSSTSLPSLSPTLFPFPPPKKVTG